MRLSPIRIAIRYAPAVGGIVKGLPRPLSDLLWWVPLSDLGFVRLGSIPDSDPVH